MVNISTQAQIAISSLLPLDRERVQQYISLLERFPSDNDVRQKSRRLKKADIDNLYMMRLPAKMRILFQYIGGAVDVIDVLTYDRLKQMYGYAA